MSVTCRTTTAVERLIVAEKRLHPTWGPKKIRRVLETKHGLKNPPVVSTVGEVLKRHGMVAEGRRRGAVFKAERGALTAPERCDHVLGVDFKGWFETGDGKRCDPMTVTDLFSRFILKIEVLPEARTAWTQAAFRALFRRQGLPDIIRVDNGAPFVAGAGRTEQVERVVDRTGHRGAVLAARLPAGQRLPRADAPEDES